VTQPVTRTELLAIAREIEVLRRKVDQIAKSAEQSAEETGRALGEIVDRLEGLTTASDQDEDDEPALVSWFDVRGGEQGAIDLDAEQLLAKLHDWMNAVLFRFPDSAKQLGESCWLWHPEVVEELLTLRAAWIEAYQTAPSPRAAMEWLSKHRPDCMTRLKTYLAACSIDRHGAGDTRIAPTVPLAAEEQVSAMAAWWVQGGRSTPPRPSPGLLAEVDARRH
jgi:hypothetical protein